MASLPIAFNGDCFGTQAALTVLVDGHAEVVDCPTMAQKWPQAAQWTTGILATLLVAAVISIIGFYSSFGQRMSVVETDISWIKSAIKLNAAAQKPTSPESVQEVSRITSELRSNRVRLDQGTVSTVGNRFANAAQQDSNAWPAVISLLAYKSFLNEETLPKFDPSRQPVDPTKYHMSLSFSGFPPGSPEKGLVAQVRTYGEASGDRSALLDSLLQPQVVVPGFEHIVVNALGSSIALDNARMKHVVLMNANVTYSGGLVSLDDVQFVNCTFEMKPTQTTIELAQSILSSPAAHFENLHG